MIEQQFFPLRADESLNLIVVSEYFEQFVVYAVEKPSPFQEVPRKNLKPEEFQV